MSSCKQSPFPFIDFNVSLFMVGFYEAILLNTKGVGSCGSTLLTYDSTIDVTLKSNENWGKAKSILGGDDGWDVWKLWSIWMLSYYVTFETKCLCVAHYLITIGHKLLHPMMYTFKWKILWTLMM